MTDNAAGFAPSRSVSQLQWALNLLKVGLLFRMCALAHAHARSIQDDKDRF